MTNEERVKVINQLVSLRAHCMDMKDEDGDIWSEDIEALNLAINELSNYCGPLMLSIPTEAIDEVVERIKAEMVSGAFVVDPCEGCERFKEVQGDE